MVVKAASASSIRQRVAAGSSDESSSLLHRPSSNTPRQNRGQTGFRVNKVLGRIVPLILITYLYYTYKLVIVCYAYKFLYRKLQLRVRTVLWAIVLHLNLLVALRAYLKVFIARSATPGAQISRFRVGATFADPGVNDFGPTKSRFELCQPDGSPLLCWRDKCNGRMKTFRTRHCGDCGVCRVGFDHHCAWFDNDVTAPDTLRPFLLFLGCVPPLIGLALGPMMPSLWQTSRQIGSFARANTDLGQLWWDRWYSWLGGPVFRWMVGWCLGAKRWSQVVPRSERLPHEIISAPMVGLFGVVFIFIATALAYSTIRNLTSGLLTVDVEREKAYQKLLRRRATLLSDTRSGHRAVTDAILVEIDAKLHSLEPIAYFRARQAAASINVDTRAVPLSMKEGLFSRGSAMDNLRYFLWDVRNGEQMELSQQAINHLTAAES